MRFAWHVLTTLDFFILFHSRMADREAGFTAAFMSLCIVVTLIAYTLVVLFLA